MGRLKPFLFGFLAGTLVASLLAVLFLKPILGDLTIAHEMLIQTGASPTPTDVQNSLEILSKININQADAKELEELPGIGEVKARAIIEFREKYGEFANLEELLYIPGITANLLEAIKFYVYVK